MTVDRPDVSGRVQILKVHSRGKQIGKDVDFDKVARRTPGEHRMLTFMRALFRFSCHTCEL